MAIRKSNNEIRNIIHGNIKDAFNFENVYLNAKKCTRNVGYKKSTVNFKLHMFSIVGKTCIDIKENNYKVGKTYNFIINERGKERIIDAPLIGDRLVHKVISNSILSPIYEPNYIYDNGASLVGKGFSFAINRVKILLRKWYKKHGMNGYIVLIDFSKFFPNCSHDVINNIHNKYINDSYTRKVIEDYLYVKTTGIALGVEIAQREALMVPNQLDTFITNLGYPIIRYTIFICPTYEEATSVLNEYINLSESLHIIVNKHKTKIIHVSKPFIFCKWKYVLLPSGKVINFPSKKTIYRQRRKLIRMIKKK